MTTVEKTKKPRPIWMKKGSYKYLLELLHGIKPNSEMSGTHSVL